MQFPIHLLQGHNYRYSEKYIVGIEVSFEVFCEVTSLIGEVGRSRLIVGSAFQSLTIRLK